MDRPPGLWNCDCHLRVCGNPATNKELAMKLVKLSLLVVMTALLGSLPAFGRPFTPRDLVMLSHIGHPAVSSAGRWLAWDQGETDMAANSRRHELWRLDLSGGRRALTRLGRYGTCRL